jgi:hypothetical protein
MKKAAVTNETLWDTDFAADEKVAVLRRMTGAPRTRSTLRTRGVTNCWMQDVSASDARSVKAWLNGRGDFRVLAWRMKNFLNKLTLKQQELVEKPGPAVSKKGGQWAWKLDWVMHQSKAETSPAN